jgi:hypothetical protein
MFDWGVQKVSIFFLSPKIMSSRPIRKSIPMAKLTADNVGDIELTSHHRAIASNQAQVAQPENAPTPSSPSSDPLDSTSATATLEVSHTPASTKQPQARPLVQAISIASIQTLPDTDPGDPDSDEGPKAKKAKATPHSKSALQPDLSIIEIDDGDDQQNERLNKVSKTADIRAFFMVVTLKPGQKKGYMKCTTCA